VVQPIASANAGSASRRVSGVIGPAWLRSSLGYSARMNWKRFLTRPQSVLDWILPAYLGIAAPVLAAFIHSASVFSRKTRFGQAELRNIDEPALWVFLGVETAITFIVVWLLRKRRWGCWLAWLPCVGIWILWAFACEGPDKAQRAMPNNPAPGKAGITSGFVIGPHWPGLPEPERSA